MSQQRRRNPVVRAVGAAVRAPGRNLESNRFLPQLVNLARDMMNDVRASLHQFFWGQPEGPPTMGTPMSPTPHMVNDLLGRGNMQRNVPQRTVAPPVQRPSLASRLKAAVSIPRPQVQAQARQQVQVRHRGIER